MFNDLFNLTKLVLEGIKTHTRRLELDCNIRFYLYNYEGSYPKIEDNKVCIYSDDGYLLATRNTRYKIGEEVAIAQSYSQCGDCRLIEDEDANGEAWCSFHQKPIRCNSRACKDILKKGVQNERD